MEADATARSQPDRLSALRESARGWHTVQLAVLGFVGICGVLLDDWTTQPRWLQVLAGLIAVLALVLACVATYLIGRAAWPVYGLGARSGGGEDAQVEAVRRQLATGLVLTFAAVACVALATLAAWWPQDADDEDATVQVESASRSWCGQLRAGRPRTLDVVTDRGRVTIPVEAVVTVAPVSGC